MADKQEEQAEEKLTPAQQAVLELEASPAFTHEQMVLLRKLVASVAPEAEHGGYTYEGKRLWGNQKDQAHRIERDPETGLTTEYNGPGGKK